MGIRTVVLAALAAAPLAVRAQGKLPKLAVLEFTTSHEAGRPTVSLALLDAATAVAQSAVEHFGLYTVVSRSDIATALGVAADKQKLGCAEDAQCMAEIAGALGVERILSGKVERLTPQTAFIDVVIIDARTAARLNHVTHTVTASDDQLVGQVQAAVAELLAEHTPLITGAFEVITTPPGVQVWLDGRYLGNSPFSTDRPVREGRRSLMLRGPGRDLTDTLVVKAGQVATVRADFGKQGPWAVTYRTAATPPPRTDTGAPQPAPVYGQPAAPPPAPGGGMRTVRNVGLVITGVGVVTTIVGYAMVDTSLPDYSNNPNNGGAYTTAGFGLVITLVGAVVAGVGFCGSFASGSGGDLPAAPPARLTVSAGFAPIPGGAMAGVGGRF